MGYAFCLGRCACCPTTFSFNPLRVPSIRIDGIRQPVCKDCIEKANAIRVEHGLPPHTYHADAYEPVDERELNYGD